MESLKEVLMRRDGMEEEEAEDLIKEAREALADYLEEGDLISAEEVCEEFFDLEPDYLEEFLPI